MVAGWIGPLVPVLGLTANVIVLVALMRTLPRLGLLRAQVLAFLAGALAVGALALGTGGSADGGEATARLLVDLLAYGALGYGFFHFNNLGETARRIRLLRELQNAGPRGLTLEEILSRYGAREIFERRIARLVGTGQMVRENGRWVVRSRVLLGMARTMVLLKLLFLGKRSEFA